MYKLIIRPLLFLLPPETIHKLLVVVVKVIFSAEWIQWLVRKAFSYNSERLKTKISGLVFENKVGLAAGFDKNADFYEEFSVFGFSFIEIGTVTPKAQDGNSKPRLFRIRKDLALINRMGFNNKGVQYAKDRIIKRRKKDKRLLVGGNIGKNTLTLNEHAADDYLFCFRILYDAVDYFVVNVSCPNIADLHELQHIGALRGILEKIAVDRGKMAQKKPVFLKISPDLTFPQIDEILDLCRELDMDGIVATNTTTQRYNLTYPEKRIEGIGNGGLSGGPLKDRATEIIRYIHEKTEGRMPVIGVGGIITPDDALEKIKAGAWLVQIYTGFIYEGPLLAKRINKVVDRFLQEQEETH